MLKNTEEMWCFWKTFYNCPNLEHIYIGEGWDTSGNTDKTYLTFGSPMKLPNYDMSVSDRQDLKYAHAGEGGYFTLKTN